MADPVSNLQRVVLDAQTLIDAINPDDLAKPTPCASWDVRGLINHMIGTSIAFTNVLSGTPISMPSEPTDHVGTDPAGAYARAADALVQAWSAPGALDKLIQMMSREVPGAVGIRIVTADQLLHTWDVAKSLNRPFQMDPDMAEATLGMMQQMSAGFPRGPEHAFDVPVPCPDDAPVQDRLVAFSGRMP